jgi:hypothetical protein
MPLQSANKAHQVGSCLASSLGTDFASYNSVLSFEYEMRLHFFLGPTDRPDIFYLVS